jgi:hypothetical protein
MKRLFLLAAVMFAAVVTSCNNDKGEADDGSVKMHIVSEDILTFNYLGGEHSSYYTIKNIPQDSIIVANTSEDWVHSFVTKNIGEVRYTIDPNDSGVERRTSMTVSCKDAFVVYDMIQRAADVTCKAGYASCDYYGTTISDNANFLLKLALQDPYASDVSADNISYVLDLYVKRALQPGDEQAIPLGEYVLDPINTGDNNVIYKNTTTCMVKGTSLTFGTATLRVEKDRMVFYGKTNDGRWHLATFYGKYEFNDKSK